MTHLKIRLESIIVVIIYLSLDESALKDVCQPFSLVDINRLNRIWYFCRDDIYNQLLLMKNHLSDLSFSREDIQRLDSQRNLLSKEISMVREMEALGSAMSSHPLNTLSQRFSVYKKKRNDVGLIKNILMEKAMESERMMEDYLSFVDETSSGRIKSTLMDIKSNYGAKTLLSEFDLIKEFLESSNQGQTYVQSEQNRQELDASVLQQQKIIATSFEALVQYFNVVNFYPHDHVMNHRFAKYSQWCRSLIVNKSQDFVRQVANDYHKSFGDAIMKDHKPENIIAFTYQLQTFLVDASYQRDISIQSSQQFKEKIDKKRGFSVVMQEFRDFVVNQSLTLNPGDENFSVCEMAKMAERLLTIEMSTFATTAEVLSDSIINDRWYINELKVQSSFLVKVSNVFLESGSPRKNSLLNNSVDCLKATTESLETFSRVTNDFQLNIIPQTLKGIISQDKSVLEMISELSNIQSVMPLQELSLKLQEDLHNCIHNPNQQGYMNAADLTEAYNKMVNQYEMTPEATLGKKIFLALHGMFADVSKASKKVLSFDKATSSVPEEWKQIFEIQQARNLFISPMKASICMTLEQIFLVKRIQTMIKFFSRCLQIAWAFNGSGVSVNFDLEFLTQPLKSYITDCLTKFVLGRGSYSLCVIICCLVDKKQFELKRGNSILSLNQLVTATKPNVCEKFFLTLEEHFRKEDDSGYYKKLAQLQAEHVKHLTHILSAHHWLHEDEFVAHQNVLPPLPRAALLIQLQTYIQSLSNWNTSIQKINDDLKQCTLVVMQRLKWASGVNPMVSELMKNFEAISNAKSVQLDKNQLIAACALKHCYSVLNYEMLRFKTPKAIMSDGEFLNFLQQWENVCIAERNVSHTVNPIEEALVELLDPEGKIERAWINNVTSLIDDMINQVHSDIDSREKSVMAARDNLDLNAHKLRSSIASHHRISADIRNLLKSILKHDDSDQNKALKEYLAKYKTFIDNVTELHGNVLSKDFTDSMVKRTIEQVHASLAVINEVYNDLFTFEKTLSSTFADSSHKRLLRNQSENLSIEYPGSPIKKGLYLQSNGERSIDRQEGLIQKID